MTNTSKAVAALQAYSVILTNMAATVALQDDHVRLTVSVPGKPDVTLSIPVADCEEPGHVENMIVAAFRTLLRPEAA